MKRNASAQAEALGQLRRRATRVLFAASLLFAPMPFSMLFVVGLVPLSWTIDYFLRMIMVTPRGVGAGETPLVAVILAVHLIVDGGLLYLLWTVICRLLFRFFPGRAATSAVVLLLSGQVIASFFPVYLLAGEHDTDVVPLMRVWQELVLGGH